MRQRTELDVLRSLQRYTAAALPAPWDVRIKLEHEEPVRPWAYVTANGGAATTGRPQVLDLAQAFTVHAYLPKPESGRRDDAEEAALELRQELWEHYMIGAGDGRPWRIPLWTYAGRDEVQTVELVDNGTLSFEGQVTTPLDIEATARDMRLALEALSTLEPGDVSIDGPRRGLYTITFTGSKAAAPQALLVGSAGVTVERLVVGDPDPWRAHCDFMRIADIAHNTIVDPEDPALLMVAVDLRLTWWRRGAVISGETVLQRITHTTA